MLRYVCRLSVLDIFAQLVSERKVTFGRQDIGGRCDVKEDGGVVLFCGHISDFSSGSFRNNVGKLETSTLTPSNA
jgi:hypothetical protein